MRFDDVFICYSDLKIILKGIDSSTTSKELARYVFELYAGADIGSIDMSKLKTGMIDEYNYMDDFQETDWIKEALYFEKILNNHVLEDNRESMEILDEAIHGFDCVQTKMGLTALSLAVFIEQLFLGHGEIADFRQVLLSSKFYTKFKNLPKSSSVIFERGLMKMEEEPQTEGLAIALYEAINAFEEFLCYIPVIDYYTFMGWFILLFALKKDEELCARLLNTI